jgi:hypothetical protein
LIKGSAVTKAEVDAMSRDGKLTTKFWQLGEAPIAQALAAATALNWSA